MPWDSRRRIAFDFLWLIGGISIASLIVLPSSRASCCRTSSHQLNELLSGQMLPWLLPLFNDKRIGSFQRFLHAGQGRIADGWAGHQTSPVYHPRRIGSTHVESDIHTISDREGAQIFQ